MEELELELWLEKDEFSTFIIREQINTSQHQSIKILMDLEPESGLRSNTSG